MRPTPFFYVKPFRNGMQLKSIGLVHKWQKNQNLFFFPYLTWSFIIIFFKIKSQNIDQILIYSMIHLVRNILWEPFFSTEAAMVLVMGSFCRYVSGIYESMIFITFRQCFIALCLARYYISKANHWEKLLGGPTT